ncbi:hypothetical protein OAF27_03280 [Verrucomicrobiales bacterium]|nr:hypothetical protein [Verrucomicrobiales bacterium]
MHLLSSPVSRVSGVFFVALSISLAVANARTWTSAKSGKTLEADFVELTDSAVVVKMADGTKRTLPLDSLIADDLAEAKKLQDAAEGYGEEERPELPDDDGPIELVVLGFHLCCEKAKDQFVKAAGSAGTVAKIDERLSLAKITAQSSADGQKAIDAIMKAGFFGDVSAKGGSTDVKFYAAEMRPSTVEKASFALPNPIGCEESVATLNNAIEEVSGVKEGKVNLGSYDFTVTGEFDPAEVIQSLRSYGYNATLK